jgi:stage V sporulation protein S
VDGETQVVEQAEEAERIIRVTGSANTQQLASAVAHAIYDHEYDGAGPKLRAVGAGAVNQACKALAICAGYVGARGMTMSTRIGFEPVDIDGKEHTSLVFKLVVDR